jgi:hypothetical protein
MQPEKIDVYVNVHKGLRKFYYEFLVQDGID